MVYGYSLSVELPIVMAQRAKRQGLRGSVSKLFRNVPFLTSIEMSPFFVVCLFLLAMVVFSKNLASGCPRNDDPFLGRLTGSRFFRSVGLARSAALRSP
jgi:hypothetical protein